LDIDSAAGTVAASASYRATFERGAGTIFVVFEQAGGDWLLLRLKVDAPELLDDPAQYREVIEILVENSDPVVPGTIVDLYNTSQEPPKLLIEGLRVLNVRWKMVGPGSAPAFPASGFVGLSLTKEQVDAVEEARRVSVRKQSRGADNGESADPL